MIGGIFETLGKTLGVGEEKYFLELDDAAEPVAKNVQKTAKKVTKPAEQASADVAEKAQKQASDVASKAKDVTPSVADETAAKAKGAAKTVEKKVKQAASDKKKAKKAPASKKKADAKSSKGKSAEVAPDAEKAVPDVPAVPDPEELIVNAIAAASSSQTLNSNDVAIATAKTFATDYLETPIRTSRRRPGPSLAGFKKMAKEANPQLRG
ncbi:MAG: hypothetical protein AAF810_03805 [Cyanobacteria bacterium P01_D01_bin.36]